MRVRAFVRRMESWGPAVAGRRVGVCVVRRRFEAECQWQSGSWVSGLGLCCGDGHGASEQARTSTGTGQLRQVADGRNGRSDCRCGWPAVRQSPPSDRVSQRPTADRCASSQSRSMGHGPAAVSGAGTGRDQSGEDERNEVCMYVSALHQIVSRLCEKSERRSQRDT